jgi:beta-N-acetylhexosaminidase
VGSRFVISSVVVLVVAAITLGCSRLPGETETSSAAPGGAPAGTSLVDVTTGSTAATSTSTTTTVPTTLLSPAQEILQRMTLRQKAAQVLLLAFDGATMSPVTEELLRESPPGGFLLLSRNVEAREQLRALTIMLQDTAAHSGAGIGLFIAVDQEGGSVQRIHTGVPHVPAARKLGDTSTPAEAARLAEETARGLLDLGVNMNLAPVADVVSDPKSFLYNRSYGGDPTVVVHFVKAVTEAFVQDGLIVVVKHFPGHGSAAGNTHGQVVVSEASQADFATIHLPPFKAAFASGAEGVMVAHVIVNAYDPDRPASMSDRVIEGLLREGLGFSGLVVSDDLEMAAAAAAVATGGTESEMANDPGALAVLALEAGCDLLISTGTLARQRAMIDAIVEAVQTGRLAQSRLDEAVLCMLDVKLRHGLALP